LEAFEAAYQREPKSGYALALGYAYVNAKRYAEAAPILEQASQLAPENLALYQDVAYAYLHSFQNDKAVEWFKKGIDARMKAREDQTAASTGQKDAVAYNDTVLQPDIDAFGQLPALRRGIVSLVAWDGGFPRTALTRDLDAATS